MSSPSETERVSSPNLTASKASEILLQDPSPARPSEGSPVGLGLLKNLSLPPSTLSSSPSSRSLSKASSTKHLPNASPKRSSPGRPLLARSSTAGSPSGSVKDASPRSPRSPFLRPSGLGSGLGLEGRASPTIGGRSPGHISTSQGSTPGQGSIPPPLIASAGSPSHTSTYKPQSSHPLSVRTTSNSSSSSKSPIPTMASVGRTDSGSSGDTGTGSTGSTSGTAGSTRSPIPPLKRSSRSEGTTLRRVVSPSSPTTSPGGGGDEGARSGGDVKSGGDESADGDVETDAQGEEDDELDELLLGDSLGPYGVSSGFSRAVQSPSYRKDYRRPSIPSRHTTPYLSSSILSSISSTIPIAEEGIGSPSLQPLVHPLRVLDPLDKWAGMMVQDKAAAAAVASSISEASGSGGERRRSSGEGGTGGGDVTRRSSGSGGGNTSGQGGGQLTPSMSDKAQTDSLEDDYDGPYGGYFKSPFTLPPTGRPSTMTGLDVTATMNLLSSRRASVDQRTGLGESRGKTADMNARRESDSSLIGMKRDGRFSPVLPRSLVGSVVVTPVLTTSSLRPDNVLELPHEAEEQEAEDTVDSDLESVRRGRLGSTTRSRSRVRSHSLGNGASPRIRAMSKVRGDGGEDAEDGGDEADGRGSRIGSRMDDSMLEEENDPFKKTHTIKFDQPVGSMSISPASRDVALASRKGLYILDLANLHQQPRFIPQGGKWQIADCQWSPHPNTSNLILTTSSQKLLVWDLLSTSPSGSLHRIIDAHFRAITDINWHARDPNILASTGIDGGVRAFDLRVPGPDAAVIRLSAWGVAGTQVKWNRQHDHILASSHANEVHIWDTRKGSVPITIIKAHASRIYGIDWDRRTRHQLVTCSLDKTIKSWSINELDRANSERFTRNVFFPSVDSPAEPDVTIHTTAPVWRARNLPFGSGILSVPQRGENSLEMWSLDPHCKPRQRLIKRFDGHTEPVKEFVWRTRGGENAGFEDRDFQLISWGKDRTLRIRPIDLDILERASYRRGSKINVLVSRRGAPDISYATQPDEMQRSETVSPSPHGILTESSEKINVPRQVTSRKAVMTRGGAGRKNERKSNEEQLDWFMNVHLERRGSNGATVTESSREGSRQTSRLASISRTASQSREASRDRSGRRSRSRDVSAFMAQQRGSDINASWVGDEGENISLQEEIRRVSQTFPKAKFENLEVAKRRYTVTMNGPWAEGGRPAFLRVQFTFPAQYPLSLAQEDSPQVNLETSVAISRITKTKMLAKLEELRHDQRPCLSACIAYLLGYGERGRLGLRQDESDSDEEDIERLPLQQPMMPKKACGASFGPNGELVCFFKSTPSYMRNRVTSSSRSPSSAVHFGAFRPTHPSLAQAVSALSSMAQGSSPEKSARGLLRSTLMATEPSLMEYNRGRRRVHQAAGLYSKANSTVAIRYLDNADRTKRELAKMYKITGDSSACETNYQIALKHSLVEHAQIWKTLASLLAGTVSPPAACLPIPKFRRKGHKNESDAIQGGIWKHGMLARVVVDGIIADLERCCDTQMLSIVTRFLEDYDRQQHDEMVSTSIRKTAGLQPDYFGSRHIARLESNTEGDRQTPRFASPSPSSPFSFSFSSSRQSGWAMTPANLSMRSGSGFFMPRGRQDSEGSLYNVTREDGQVLSSIAVPSAIRSAHHRSASPRERESSVSRVASTGLGSLSPSVAMASTPLRTDTTNTPPPPPIGSHSKTHRVSFGPGSFSPITNKRLQSQPGVTPKTARLPKQVHVVPWDIAGTIQPDADANRPMLDSCNRQQYECWRLAYANMLSRWELYLQQAEILQRSFSSPVSEAPRGRTLSLRATAKPSQSPASLDLSTATVCDHCGANTSGTEDGKCRICENYLRNSCCTVCELPIAGLSFTCMKCRHATHEACYSSRLAHIARSTSAPVFTSCLSGCGCECLVNGGLTGQFDAVNVSPPGTVRVQATELSATAMPSPLHGIEDGMVTPTLELVRRLGGDKVEEDPAKTQRTGLLARAGIRNLTGDKFNFFGAL